MSRDEWLDFKAWCKRHENYTVWTCIGTALTILMSVLIGGMPADSKTPDGWIWDWFQFFLVVGIGGSITLAPTIGFGANRLIYRGRHAVGITREAKRDREVQREAREAAQARELVEAHERILELERSTGIPPLEPFTRSMVDSGA